MLKLQPSRDRIPAPDKALPGRAEAIPTSRTNRVTGRPLAEVLEHDEATGAAMFGMGCFWGVERLFWTMQGVVATAVGYAGGHTPNPTYREVCSGKTGHAEVVRIRFDPSRLSYAALLDAFWRSHDPTQGMRQGNDRGTQYRSAIYTFSDRQAEAASASGDAYGRAIAARGFGAITTEIVPAGPFYFAEDIHQQYLHHTPHGYCSLRGLGVDPQQIP